MTTVSKPAPARQSTRKAAAIIHVAGLPSPQEVSDALLGIKVKDVTPDVRARMERAYQATAAELLAVKTDMAHTAQRCYEAAALVLADIRDGHARTATATKAPAPKPTAAEHTPPIRRPFHPSPEDAAWWAKNSPSNADGYEVVSRPTCPTVRLTDANADRVDRLGWAAARRHNDTGAPSVLCTAATCEPAEFRGTWIGHPA
jgi:hypothetical protein